MRHLLPPLLHTTNAGILAGALAATLNHIGLRKEDCYTVDAQGYRTYVGVNRQCMFICEAAIAAGLDKRTAKMVSEYMHASMGRTNPTFNEWVINHFPVKYHTWENTQRLRKVWLKRLTYELKQL